MNESKFTLERVPLPAILKGRHAEYPYAHMHVGDSFFAPKRAISTGRWQQTTGFRFTTRAVVENGQRGVRVWRIA